MPYYFNLGNESFRVIRNGTYVDKSGLIAFFNRVLDTPNRFVCASRPRRFGKSFAAKMLCSYYGKGCDSRALFEDLEIAKDPTFEKHLNRYNVVYLDISMFISRASRIEDTVKDMERKVRKDLVSMFPAVDPGEDLAGALYNLARQTGDKLIMIIDEWDAIFREAPDNKSLQDEYLDFLRGLFGSSLAPKTFHGVYMTGILPIRKRGERPALEGFAESSMLAPAGLERFIGFTEPEVRALCSSGRLDFEEAKSWYDGYSFPGVGSVWCPNSVMDAIRIGRCGNYWTQTETYEALRVYIDMDLDGLKEAIAKLLAGGRVRIDTSCFQNDMTTIGSRDDALTLLVHLGYLAYDSGDKTARIPNNEVRKEFVRTVARGGRPELARLVRNSDRLLEATVAMDEETVAKLMDEVHQSQTAPLFYNDEQALRSVVKLAYLSAVDEFLRIEELPSGRGFADVVFVPKKASALPLLVVELKWNKTAKGALDQIRRKDYPDSVRNYGGEVLLVGINYDSKSAAHTCRIEKLAR